MKKILLMLALAAILSFGCASMGKGIIDIANEDAANAEISKEVANKFLKTWSINSGFVRGSLGDRINQLPVGVVKAMDELDALAAKTSWTDFELGYSLGLRIRLLSEIVAQALKLYAPEVLKYIPMTF